MAGSYVFKENTFTVESFGYAGGGSVTVESDAYILGTGGAAFALSPALWNVKVEGSVVAAQTGISFLGTLGNPVGNSRLTVGVDGAIIATQGGSQGIDIGVPLDITNAGLIEGVEYGINVHDFGATKSKAYTIANTASGDIVGQTAILAVAGPTVNIKNQGLIEATGANAIVSFVPLNLTNSGRIAGNVLSDFNLTTAETLINSGFIGGDIALSQGADKLQNSGIILGKVDLYEGNDTLTNSAGGDIRSTIVLGEGNDTFTNAGNCGGDLFLGDGDNKAGNTGTIDGDVTGGSAKDVLVNSGTVAGSIDLGEGNNSLTNSGTIERVTFGDGNDSFTNTGKAGGTIELGGGDDKFTGGAQAERVADQAGADVYKLGGGNDILTLTSGLDACDGGLGQDSLDVSWLGIVAVNLDTKAHSLGPFDLDPASVRSKFAGATVKGFEVVLGGNDVNIFVGGVAAERFFGGNSGDLLAGGLGADALNGGGGDDVFFYLRAKDSGTTKLTRDTITGFQGAGVAGGDTIDLSRVDANSKQAGDQGFAFIGNNLAFNKVAGELRSVTLSQDTLIQGDVNGDGKVDFEIALVGFHVMQSGDFVP